MFVVEKSFLHDDLSGIQRLLGNSVLLSGGALAISNFSSVQIVHYNAEGTFKLGQQLTRSDFGGFFPAKMILKLGTIGNDKIIAYYEDDMIAIFKKDFLSGNYYEIQIAEAEPAYGYLDNVGILELENGNFVISQRASAALSLWTPKE